MAANMNAANTNHGDQIARINELREMITTAEQLGEHNTNRLQELNWQLRSLLDTDDETVASSTETPDETNSSESEGDGGLDLTSLCVASTDLDDHASMPVIGHLPQCE